MKTAARLDLFHPVRKGSSRTLERDEIASVERLLSEIVREGRRVAEPSSLEVMRERCRRDLERLDPGVRRLVNPHVYHVSLTRELWELKQQMVGEVKEAG